MDLRTLARLGHQESYPRRARRFTRANFGGEQKQFIVNVNPQKLKSFGLTLAEVRDAVRQASTVGLPKVIDRLAADQCRYNLAVSLHAADDPLRTRR